MPLFGPRRGAPRLAPELDDSSLGRIRRLLRAPTASTWLSSRIDQTERLLAEPEGDWDRRMHRILVLADAAPPAFAEAWRTRRPRRADPALFEAWTSLTRARRDGAPEDSKALIRTCYQAADLAPEDPAPWIALLGTLRLLRRPLAEVLPAWREATARDAWSREAHLQMLGYLSPQECGTPGRVLDFIDSMRTAVPPDAPTAGVELVSLVERHLRTVSGGGVTALMASDQWNQPQAAAALDQALTSWPKPGHLTHAQARADLNLLAYALIQANRVRDAAEVFPAIGGLVTAWPWGLDGDPVRQFILWQGRATS